VKPTTPERALIEGIRKAALKALNLEPETVPLTYPPKPELGDLATPVCFELARAARRPPRELAKEIVEAFVPHPAFERLEVAGGGYINAFLDRPGLVRRLLAGGLPSAPEASGGKIIVEHTNINPNKAAHIGHLRNAVLGDTLVRFLRRLGRRVETQNYIDDTGVQVADLVVGFLHLRNEDLDGIRERYAEPTLRAAGQRFDYIAWDLYAEVTRHYAEDATRLSRREEVLHAMEQGDNPVAELAAHVAQRIVQHHLTTMERIGVRYDLLPRESDILALRFWDKAFTRLKESGTIHKADAGKHAGCWVMDLPGAQAGAGEDQKVIVRSNGTVTYVGKDIAYQMWKFGLLGRDFRYCPFDWNPLSEIYEVWRSSSDTDAPDHPAFGGGETVYNVIDTRQSYLQRVVTQGLRSLGHEEQAERSVHYAYEMVALTPASVALMFPDFPLDEADRARPYIEMAGRKGLGVRADELLDILMNRATDEIRKRNADLPAETVEQTATRISVGALRYYMLRFSRNRVVAFDLDATLSFEGETGPYLQYSVVRARNILGKFADRHGSDATEGPGLAPQVDLAALPAETQSDHWNLVLLLLRTEAVLGQAVDSLELSLVAKHAYALAQTFNSFYHRYPVIQEEDETIRATRVGLVRLYHDGMVDLLDLMGITVPDRM